MNANKDRVFACFAKDRYPVPNSSRAHRSFDSGLSARHAYAIIKAIPYKGKRFLKVRNPWGETDWAGKWSDGSKEWVQENWSVDEALKALEYKFGDDGEFIMECKPFNLFTALVPPLTPRCSMARWRLPQCLGFGPEVPSLR